MNLAEKEVLAGVDLDSDSVTENEISEYQYAASQDVRMRPHR